MDILLDESLPAELAEELTGHHVVTVQELGWPALKNGELLARSAGRFDAFLTADQNLRYPPNLSSLPIAVVVLVAKSNRLEYLRPLLPRLIQALAKLRARTLIAVRP